MRSLQQQLGRRKHPALTTIEDLVFPPCNPGFERLLSAELRHIFSDENIIAERSVRPNPPAGTASTAGNLERQHCYHGRIHQGPGQQAYQGRRPVGVGSPRGPVDEEAFARQDRNGERGTDRIVNLDGG